LRLETAGAGRLPSGKAANLPALESREAVRRMAAEPPVDSARVSELRESIASGRYRVDPEKIADAMLRSEPGLLRR
jgi:negative regulator of flagellin synthesis FlgM